jgi:hypothetical protein
MQVSCHLARLRRGQGFVAKDQRADCHLIKSLARKMAGAVDIVVSHHPQKVWAVRKPVNLGDIARGKPRLGLTIMQTIPQ